MTNEMATAIVSAPKRGGMVRSRFVGTLWGGRPVTGLSSVTVGKEGRDPEELMRKPPRAKGRILLRIGRPFLKLKK